jgi:hypothetical protein
LSFEEGINRIGTGAFQNLRGLETVAFPASLQVIGEFAFLYCTYLRHLSFPTGSQLRCIHGGAFTGDRLETVFLPANVQEIDPSAFDYYVWPRIEFEGPPPISITDRFLCSADSRILLAILWSDRETIVPAAIEVIGPGVFADSDLISSVVFETGTRLKEIGEAAFAKSYPFTAFVLPSSVETLGDRCFEKCGTMTKFTFEDSSKLKRIGERAFAKAQLTSITIPASTEEIDGSAFVDCPLREIRVAAGCHIFMIEGNMLLTSFATEIVRYFGEELEIIVPSKVEILGKSCFEACNEFEQILFANDSKLRRIGRSALANCESLKSISIPAGVEIIEESAFKRCPEFESCSIAENASLATIEKESFYGCQSLSAFYIPRSVQIIGENCFQECRGLESCLIAEDSALARIEKGTFSECNVLRSFCIPKSVEFIGEDCFRKCCSLHRLRFVSGESLQKFIYDSSLDEALGFLGCDEVSSLLVIEIEDENVTFDFSGWSSVSDESSHLTLVRAIP